ncbi:gfo/Idh/MocA family oxidoreductase [Rhodobacteraceae bacterium 2CG4]|uniref:Gfo/Idh/MocA family oxidoreductase n=1 Tax=Halovulum marinum TaxID=2662447 RepID=A0A6L5YWW9_9RHOB|nr:Gfo/Idh/MocA family oxidoreductase [Halovulum marinum]MSU88821.1 gfo/Idh/MocA family oxidoreductase [Halovulum marinum]
MSLGVGVIGAGIMGADHARIIREETADAHLVGVADADLARAERAAAGARAVTDGMALIGAGDVDAVIVASPDPTHAPLTLAAIAAGKPVLCEKPLAVTPEDCLRIAEAEAKAGRKLVHTGFMRRFDPAYGELKAAIDGGGLGPVRLLHCLHRNQYVPGWFQPQMAITNSFVHEIDVCRWLLGAEFVAATVIPSTSDAYDPLGDPLLIVLETDAGALVSTEVSMNAEYGYHVHAEAVCARGTVAMAEPARTLTRTDGARRSGYPVNWIPRFADAYRIQARAWVAAIGQGSVDAQAADVWDGAVATILAEQIVEALRTRRRVALELPPRPQ